MLMTVVYTVVVGFIRRGGGLHDPYPAFLLCALISWKAFSQSISQSITSLARNEGLINSFSFPKAVIPISLVSCTHVLLLFALWPLLLVVLFYEYIMRVGSIHLAPTVFIVPLLIFVQFILSLGGALFFSAFGAFFKDLENIMTHILQASMFLSPCLYSIADVLPGYSGLAELSWSGWKTLYVLNPMAHVIRAYRETILYGNLPDFWGLLFSLFAGVLAVVFGLFVFNRRERMFAKVL